MEHTIFPPPDRARIKTTFMRMLQREHSTIMHRFPGARSAMLDLRPLKNFWGRWLPEERVIAISESL
ncbi:MAG: hypothetical protein LBQ79_06710, partial [Deltaproteobacteria bacterium]|nr:hypothetical protein [Deltaproteobacteria bacterium]